ncbi:hypothetical protein HPB50_001302 [Hyalomma asiaticum]|uniref:Uncharacterized protein n=1 Tax=Hyalomma asiaticum TaxID=266040 RepID=A0ACB7SAA2_HYAAI|nr:hypothetical protein HPB50_001302 [Hyalomma asiaticum]
MVPGRGTMTSSDPPGALTDAPTSGTIKRLFTEALDSRHGCNATGIAYTVMPEVNAVEEIWCKLLLNDGSVYVGAVYRPPKADAKYPNPLLDHMNLYMLGGTIIMADRYQFVHYNGYSSDTVKVLSGVPQGSVLAPLLFLLFIDDIVEAVNVEADDCMIYSEIKDIGDQVDLNSFLNNVAQWCRE